MTHIKSSRYFRLSVTNQCTLKCYFCHNEGQNKDLCKASDMTKDDIIWVVEMMKKSGFTKFKLTGGEPTLRKDLPEIIQGIRSMGIDDVSIISNGTLLGKMVQSLKDAGLKRINVSLYSINEDRFIKNNGGTATKLKAVKYGINKAIQVGYTDMKINYIFHGMEAVDDLKAVLQYVSEKKLTLVLLPLIPVNINKYDEDVSLDQLYKLISDWGIQNEQIITDTEGIEKRLIVTNNKAKILLRNDELKDKSPFKHCFSCDNKSECREGIFPLRMSSNGTLRPCLAGGVKGIPTINMIRARDSVSFLKTIQSINI